MGLGRFNKVGLDELISIWDGLKDGVMNQVTSWQPLLPHYQQSSCQG